MPRQIVSIPIVRNTSTPDGSGGYTQSESAISGSPFLGRVYRRSQVGIGRFEPDVPGETNADIGLVISLEDTQAGVQINDFVILPSGAKARVVRVRQYKRSTQCDTVTGVD